MPLLKWLLFFAPKYPKRSDRMLAEHKQGWTSRIEPEDARQADPGQTLAEKLELMFDGLCAYMSPIGNSQPHRQFSEHFLTHAIPSAHVAAFLFRRNSWRGGLPSKFSIRILPDFGQLQEPPSSIGMVGGRRSSLHIAFQLEQSFRWQALRRWGPLDHLRHSSL